MTSNSAPRDSTQDDATTPESEYLLGHGDREWARLEAQHKVWRGTLLDRLPGLGIGAGSRVFEAGCGNGILLRDLAVIVGPTGKAVGFERDPAAVEQARQTVADQPWATVVEGDLFALEPATEPFDLVVARWVLAWLPERAKALERLRTQVAPGGTLLVQDYNYDAIRVTPAQPGLTRLFEKMPEAYAVHGGDAWIATRLPQLFHQAGLDRVEVEPHCKAGGPESDAFRWAERFFRQHVQRLVDDGVLTEAERDASLRGWDDARATPGTVFFSPLVVNILGRVPGAA